MPVETSVRRNDSRELGEVLGGTVTEDDVRGAVKTLLDIRERFTGKPRART
ncbi:hypothetical protein FHR84_002139 [Actinopolyspora biskrensis]|uniref:Uncharacterized protein n=1 Tax=Actinopolyspora biskrensis TaxID=1470178 RepID=A0A852YUH7_9ACTN|nr:hypothetical protein [Actinopolyspora biskrensis]NYH78814.1 hypothetical protein [Actinopolyspora biskrensis]